MLRIVGHWLLLIAVLMSAAGCSRTTPLPSPTPVESLAAATLNPTPTREAPSLPAGPVESLPAATAAPASTREAPAPPASSAVSPATGQANEALGRLPAIAAQISLGLPGGDAYYFRALAFDGAGRAVALCGLSAGGVSGLVVVDLARGTRGPVLPLPGSSVGPLAAANGRAYVEYLDSYKQGQDRLAAIDLETGRVLADVVTPPIRYIGWLGNGGLAVDPDGYVYTFTESGVEVRDRETLELVKNLGCADSQACADLADASSVAALDAPRHCLYMVVKLPGKGDCLQAYQIPDWQLLWQVDGVRVDDPANFSLVIDRAGRWVYFYKRDSYKPSLLPFAADSGQALPAVAIPEGWWQLLWADSAADCLLFAGHSPQEYNPQEPALPQTRIWQAHLDGQPAGVEATPDVEFQIYVSPDGQRVLALEREVSPGSEVILVLDGANLQALRRVALGTEIQAVLPDPGAERLYVNDTAGTLYVLDGRNYQQLASLPAGNGPMALDAPNHLLFVAHEPIVPTREPMAQEVTVVDTAALTVTATISGGYKVAVDSAGHRAFVGWTEADTGPMGPGEVQIWDTRTFRRLGAIPQRGEPAYNPLRNEVYLRDCSVHIIDGQSLAAVGELFTGRGFTFPGQPLRKGCDTYGPVVKSVAVDPAQDLIIMDMADGHLGSLRRPAQLFSAGSREPMTHTATVLPGLGPDGELLALPPEDGRVYVTDELGEGYNYNTLAYPVGGAQPSDYYEGLRMDAYIPGTQVILSFELEHHSMLATDAQTGQPLGRIDCEQPIRLMDPIGRRFYTWDKSQLTVLTFEGGEP